MYPSSQRCQAQENIQSERAAGAERLNVRFIATRAAHIGRLEGISAQKREPRESTTLPERPVAATPRNSPTPGPEDRQFSENPDRGFATRNPDSSSPVSR